MLNDTKQVSDEPLVVARAFAYIAQSFAAKSRSMAYRTKIGPDRLKAAQAASGLTNDRLAALIPVSEKTWRRWKEAGTVPAYAVRQVAELLSLELEEVPPLRVQVHEGGTDRIDPLAGLAATAQELRDRQQEILTRLARIEALLERAEAGES